MKTLFVSLLITGSLANAATEINYQCIADTMQAINSDIFYNLSPSDIDSMLKDPNLVGHDEALKAAEYCSAQSPQP